MSEKLEVTIRAAEPDDYADIAALFAGKRAQSGSLQLPYASQERWRRRLETPSEDRYQLVAAVEETVVGLIGLRLGEGRRRHTADIGMAIHDSYQGRGIGSVLLAAVIDLAEGWLGVTRLELTVYTDNAAAVALYERHGFVIEGTLRRYALRGGEYVDAYMMARVHGG